MYLQDNLNPLVTSTTGESSGVLVIFGYNSCSISSPAAFRIDFDTAPALRLLQEYTELTITSVWKGKKNEQGSVLNYFFLND